MQSIHRPDPAKACTLLYFRNCCYVLRVSDMSDKFLAVLLAAMLPSLSFGQGAQSYQCSYGDLQRRVEILYETGVTVPCEVHYYKDTEAPGERQVLWRALNETGYCERKTEKFIAKLRETGWKCGQASDAGQAAEPEQADDSGQDAEPAPADDSEPDAEPAQADESEQDVEAAPADESEQDVEPAQDDDTETLILGEEAEATEE